MQMLPCPVPVAKFTALFALGVVAACDGGASANRIDAPGFSKAQARPQDKPQRVALTAPVQTATTAERSLDAERGRLLFVSKSCVICHEAGGVGGRAAPSLTASINALSADQIDSPVDPLAFAARMWRGAPAMTALQTAELGYQIDLSAEDIADLAAFAASPDEQAALAAEGLPEDLEKWLITAPVSDNEGWLDYRARGERLPTVKSFDKP